ncbi:glycosyltransferase family 9 protein [Thiohalorhabdus sp. Cl-TMA]|uniref:Glycosyltransferase family 9 protein n=1 Tax=Thiohalorhabdus methylotrophus TaxID=3242694 RepID=A0ABV4TTA9_9GAMM
MTNSHTVSSPPRSLCIVRLSAIGDVTHVVPVIRTLQHYWPETALTWVVGKVEAGLVGDLPGVEVVPYEKGGGLRELRRLRSRLSDRRFDLLLQMQTALRANVAGLGVRADTRLGYDPGRSRNGHGLFVNRRIAPNPRRHVLDGLFDFLRAMGIRERDLRWEIPVPEEARAFAAEHLPGTAPVLAINPCSSVRPRNWRNWYPERYAAVADYAVREHGMQVVLTGGPSPQEQAYGQSVADAMAHQPVNLVGRTSLKQLLAVLERSRALVAPDTGPAHMGTAAGIPVIGLFGTSNPYRTGPYLSQQWAVNRYPENLARFADTSVEQAAWGQRVRHAEAMGAIEVTDVTAKLDAVMAHSGEGAVQPACGPGSSAARENE